LTATEKRLKTSICDYDIDKLPPGIEALRANDGPQREFTRSRADVCVYGGAAGGGKTYGLLLDGARNHTHPSYNAVIFRRTSPQITAGGALWDTAMRVYKKLGADPLEHKLTFRFMSGATVKFSHMEHEKNAQDHQGAQYPYIGFDELTHFTKKQFFYLITRNRAPDGYRGACVVRATTNPTDKDDPIGGWVRELIDWWIDPDTGYAIPERSGVIRYMIIEDDKIIWVPETYRDQDGQPPRSFTFIPASVDDNPTIDPKYKSTLRAQDVVTRERLLKGNWNISYKGGMFDPSWFKVVPVAPDGIKWIRYWDFAASEVKPGKNPDWTAGAKVGMHGADMYIAHIEHFRESPATTEMKVRLCADRDGPETDVALEEEKGSAGKFVAMHFKKNILPDRVVFADSPSGDKTERASPWCALAERGQVYLVDGKWIPSFLSEAGTFPMGKKDMCDSVSGAFKMLMSGNRVFREYSGETSTFKISWDNLDSGTRMIVSQWTTDSQETAVLMMIWTARTGRLVIFDEIYTSSPDPIKLVVSMTNRIKDITGGVIRGFTGWEWYINDGAIGKAGGDIRSAYRKMRINLRPNGKFDLNGSILYVKRLLSREKLLIHTKCGDFSRQMSSWTMGANKPEDGNYLCRAVCNVVSVLWEQGRINPTQDKLPAYSQKRTNYNTMVESEMANNNPVSDRALVAGSSHSENVSYNGMV
jgi:predicted phage terminase large subunit-like protein